MNITSAIKRYKNNIELTLNGEKDFEFIYCKMSCRCIVGIKWSDISFYYDELIAKNGFKFKLSQQLCNKLDYLYFPIVRNSEEIKTKLNRQDRLDKLLQCPFNF